ncbi:hypothetical protein C5C39_02235 [Rathayibacter sp. AY1F3]|uniref:MmyB family transcriptional regulator n=1 Tax=Rathayibacter sp. AY1F3 TaxID=2080558 RepID=UPI000CE755B1|nr:hypothetical protein [Rathayibacter sp. AY1F3]PPG92849.1 hypothetical protein C5C39_02235 [Rathayibacter sp. AY1F3]
MNLDAEPRFPAADTVDPRPFLYSFVEAMGATPAVLVDRHLTVIASSAALRALTPTFARGANLARRAFIDAADAPELVHARGVRARVAAILRYSLDVHGPDDAFRALVGELASLSPHFATEWAAASTEMEQNGTQTLRHEAVGKVELRYQIFTVPDDADDLLIIGQGADPGSEAALARLASGSC